MSEEKNITKEQLCELSDEELSKVSGGYVNDDPFDEGNWLGFTQGSWAVGHYMDECGVWSSWPGIVTGLGCNINFVSGYVGSYTITILRTFSNDQKGSKTFNVNDCTKE